MVISIFTVGVKITIGVTVRARVTTAIGVTVRIKATVAGTGGGYSYGLLSAAIARYGRNTTWTETAHRATMEAVYLCQYPYSYTCAYSYPYRYRHA